MIADRRITAPAGAPADASRTPPALACVDLCKRFGENVVINHVDLTVDAGEFIALLGRSGCGKTTALRLIAGLELPDHGAIAVNGEPVVADGVWVPPEARRVGMVFQDAALFPHLTVGKNVGFGLRRGHDRRALVADALARVGLAGYEQRMPHELSGGQQQRVALARALAPRPAVILLDEPFSNLDAGLRVSVRTEVRDILDQANATAILVTHDQEEALSLADRVAVMADGRIVQDASPEELYHRPATKAIGMFVGDAQFIPAEGGGRRVRCELGDLPAHGGHTGPVDVMVRPEQLRLAPPSEGTPANATVLNRLFFGHDQLMRIQLDTGGRLNARLGSYGGIRTGDRVHVAVRGAVLTFPREERA